MIPDHVRAKDLYEKAIDLSRDSRAMNELAVLLVSSENLPKKDIKLGLDLLVRSSNLGNSSARFNLGLFYLHGHYVLKDESRGISLIRTAANQGNTGAQAFLVNLAMEAQENVVRDYPNVKEEIKFLVERGYVEMWEVASEGSRYRGLWNKFFKYEMTDRSRMLSDLMALESNCNECKDFRLQNVARKLTEVERYRQQAMRGDLNAKYMLALAYLNGEGALETSKKVRA